MLQVAFFQYNLNYEETLGTGKQRGTNVLFEMNIFQCAIFLFKYQERITIKKII